MAKHFDPATDIAKIEKKEKPMNKPKSVQGQPKAAEEPKENGEEFWAKLPILKDSGQPKRKKIKKNK